MTSDGNELKSEIVLSSGAHSTSIPSIPAAVLEALYNTVTGNKENIVKSARAARAIRIEDIEQLCHLASQWSQPFSPIFNNYQFLISSKSTDALQGTSRTRYKSLDSLKRIEPGKKMKLFLSKFSFL